MAPDILRGTIDRITYHNEENGYTVAQLMPENQSYLITVVGNMLGINVARANNANASRIPHSKPSPLGKTSMVTTGVTPSASMIWRARKK